MTDAFTSVLILYLIPLLICVTASFTEAYLRAYKRGTAPDSKIAAVLLCSLVPLINIVVSLFIIHELLAFVIGEIICSIRSRR